MKVINKIKEKLQRLKSKKKIYKKKEVIDNYLNIKLLILNEQFLL